MARGNTRPLDPTKVSWPSASLHARSAVRRKCQDGGAQCVGPAIAREKRLERLAVREVEPAAPRHQELAAGRRHAVVDRHLRAALRQGLGRHQAGRPRADHRDAFHAERFAHDLAERLEVGLARRGAAPAQARSCGRLGRAKRSSLTRSSRSSTRPRLRHQRDAVAVRHHLHHGRKAGRAEPA